MGDQDISGGVDRGRLRDVTKALLDDVAALERMIDQDLIESGIRRIGAEQEMFLVDSTGRPASQSVEVLREMLPDEASFRSITRAWFRHSSLYRILQAYADAGGAVLVTSDHGSVRGRRGAKVIGDRQTSTSLRYKHGRNLQCDERQAVKIKHPEQWGLPRRGVNTEYILAREDYYFVYPTNYHKYLEHFRDSFQHGGISLDEMVLPVVTLTGKS